MMGRVRWAFVKLYLYGRKSQSYYRKKGLAIERSYPAVHGRVAGNFHERILMDLIEGYKNEELDEVYVAYTVFVNAMHHRPVIQKLLPIECPTVEPQDFITEYGEEGILQAIIPMYLSSYFRLMIDLILLRNKLRQAMITKEVIEIISSAEALKG